MPRVLALDAAREEARGADLYVTLEPCVHWGKTPPCVERIISSGIKRVFVAVRDPNPLVDGKGIATLREAGSRSPKESWRGEARKLNEPFFKFITTKRAVRGPEAGPLARWEGCHQERRIPLDLE
jgi:diaminohydroxyphosphoribosylaminopyrimidine deaminase/5-amino-6-(5-phosphoribosylamino)uracil reductase